MSLDSKLVSTKFETSLN